MLTSFLSCLHLKLKSLLFEFLPTPLTSVYRAGNSFPSFILQSFMTALDLPDSPNFFILFNPSSPVENPDTSFRIPQSTSAVTERAPLKTFVGWLAGSLAHPLSNVERSRSFSWSTIETKKTLSDPDTGTYTHPQHNYHSKYSL